MDPKTKKRIDPGNPSECQRLIERGHLALIAIASQMHAARVEAQKAELEVALSEARGGDANMLQNWLATYYENFESRPVSVNSDVPLHATTNSSETVDGISEGTRLARAILPLGQSPLDESNDPNLNWNLLLPAARRRLEMRASELQVIKEVETATTALEVDSEDKSEIKVASDSIGELSQKQLDEELAAEEPEKMEADKEETEENPSGNLGLEALVYEDLPELRDLAAQRDMSKPLFRSGTRGLAVSIVAHTALIITLMAITMRIPEEVASLGFEASEGSAESLEIMQTVEVTAPNEISPEMTSEASDASISLPSAVGLASTSVASASQASSSMSGVQTSANRAIAATSPGRPNPAHANAHFFGAAASGNCFCYVIDGSESMRGGPWEAAKAELLRSLSSMKESHRFYIIFFNQKLNAITMPGEREPATSPLYATAENLKHAQNWIESLRIERGAPPTEALLHAIELDPDAIYLLADGATKIDVPRFLREKNRTSDFISGEQVRVPIHAIAFYSPESGQKLMQQVAMENKGQFIYVPDPRKK